ncbi:hypothetical protein R75465_03599 [Paraburkholderia aspalathi]|nr:hypothetical protein R75465_03599 [Paraburkholderia aspalathi]
MLLTEPSTLVTRESMLVMSPAFFAISLVFWAMSEAFCAISPVFFEMSLVFWAMSLVFCATFWFVVYSCEPFTASVLVALSSPTDRPVSLRAPAVPVKSTTAPAASFATVMLPDVTSCCTRPSSPLLIWFVMLLTEPSTLVTRESMFVMSPAFFAISLVFWAISDAFCAISPALFEMSLVF